MAVEAQRLPVQALADAAGLVAVTGDFRAALAAISAASAEALSADLVVLRVLDADGRLVARTASPDGSSLAAEVVGTRVSCERVARGEPSQVVVRAAERAGAAGLAVEPARAGGAVVGSVEVVRQEELRDADRALLALAAGQVALAVRTLSTGTHSVSSLRRAAWLELAGEALAAGGDPARAGHEAARIAVTASGAWGGVLWRLDPDDAPVRLASVGELEGLLPRAAQLVQEAPPAREPVALSSDDRLGPDIAHVATLWLGNPAFAALQLFYPEEARPPAADLAPLAAFAARATQALRAGERTHAVQLELDRTRALLEVVSEAVSRLSLAHTLETAVDRVAELLQVGQVGIYLRESGSLHAAAGRGVALTHAEVAERLSEALLGPLRARPSVRVHALGTEPALAGARSALAAGGHTSAVAVPLNVREEPLGLLVVFPEERLLSESDLALLTPLASQLAVAVQNARLHERATELGFELREVLEAERQASRQVSALYEISRSFAQTLSLDSTLEAVTQTLVTELGVDAAVIRLPDERGQLIPRAVHVADSRLADAVRTILERPQPQPVRPPREPVLLEAEDLPRLGGAHALLLPFLEKGSTAALVPLSTASGHLAELTVVSLDPAAPITGETLATARSIAQQAALAIDNARLYQLQKQFAETMQQSLLPRERPEVPGLEVGRVYEPAAELEVGGDVYDFLQLADGALAVVLGDVTGHGVDATADMAMAKFVFRSLARLHPEPSAFLSLANDVVVDEVQPGKFITMVYVTVGLDGAVCCASAGHPEPRLVLPDGTVEALPVGGLALGIDAPQTYDPVRAQLVAGSSIVLYTDGVIESRREGDLFGFARLDEVLAASAARGAQEIADAVVQAARSFAGGDLPDDCAVVVIKKTA